MKANRYVICPSCDAMNPSFGEVCDQCGAAIKNIPTEADARPSEPAVARTHFQSPGAMRLIGIWALSLPNVVAGVYFAIWLVRHRGGLAEFIIFWGTVGLTCLWLVIFYNVTRNYFFRNRRDARNQDAATLGRGAP